MRLLHRGHDHGGGGVPGEDDEAVARAGAAGAGGKHLSLRHPHSHSSRRDPGGERVRPAMIINATRREFIKAGGALIVNFAFVSSHASAFPLRTDPQTPDGRTDSGKPVDPAETDSFLAIHADGTVTVYTGKVDVGTGLRIAVAQMAAEELGIPAQRIAVIDGDTGLCPDQGGTGGSTGLTRGGTEIRQAAAPARHALAA